MVVQVFLDKCSMIDILNIYEYADYHKKAARGNSPTVRL